jgi:two-component system OmpR family sensor kinase
MAETAEKISDGDMSERVEHTDERTEVGRLGSAFNAMLDRLQDAFKAREESEAKVRRFAADASHELRTPLTSIRGYAELYRAGGLRDEDRLADAMGRVEAEAQRMGVLVEDLLQLARLDQQQSTERVDVDLADIATDAVADARAVEPDRTIDISVVPAQVHADEPALRQIVANLLANVRAHTPAQTPARVTVRTNNGMAELAVEDEGPGMSEEVAAHVFERFFRADESRAHGGTGLGLAIVDSIARAHGGSASVTSTEGKGARFAVQLPLVPVNGSSATS